MLRSPDVSLDDVLSRLDRFWEISGQKILLLEQDWDPANGSPVFTADGKYTTRGWTDWTQGFQHGAAILQSGVSGFEHLRQIGLRGISAHMAQHVSATGVHDHGFNNVSTYGTWRRLMMQEPDSSDATTSAQIALCELALKVSGAVQASRWTEVKDGGYIYSFNGRHSLFADTMRSLRSLALAHLLGHVLKGEGDKAISLLERLIVHANTTARFTVYYGTGRDSYDIRGRVAHESIFNVDNGVYRCPATQQGYSPFTTWTRALAWVILGFAEELEFLRTVGDEELQPYGGREAIEQNWLNAARATADYYLAIAAADGVPYWDTGAPCLRMLGLDYLGKPSQPFNDFEPVDSSAAAITAQGLLRLGHYLEQEGDGERYFFAGLVIADTLLQEPYLCMDGKHQGLLLHSVYHRPNGWDHIPAGRKVPCGESSMWGDYHLRELAWYLRVLGQGGYYTFFEPLSGAAVARN